MVVDSRAPVLVGVGQALQRPDALEDAQSPAELVAEAVRAAIADAGGRGVVDAIQSVRFVRTLSWPYADAGALVAELVGARPSETAVTVDGGNTPQMLVTLSAQEIARGELDLAVLCGGETWRTRSRYARAGIEPPWESQPDGRRPDRVLGAEVRMQDPFAAAAGARSPVHVYPLFEVARRAANGESPEDHLVRVSELWARFAAVAARNPYAWLREPRTAADIRTPSPTNRMISTPYPKAMNSNNMRKGAPLPSTQDKEAPLFDDFVSWYTGRRVRVFNRYPSPKTLRTKASRLRTAARTIEAPTPECLATTLSDRVAVELLLDKLYAQQSPGHVGNIAQALIDFGLYSEAKGWIEHSTITREDARGRNPQKAFDLYSSEEADVLLAAARGTTLRYWAFLVFLADTGRRVGEALSLEWEWYHPVDEPPYFALPITKNGKPQYAPLSRRLSNEVFTHAHIESFKEDFGKGVHRDPAVFVFPWDYATVRGRLVRLCRVSDVPYRGFHNFRHSLATRLLSEGVPLHAVSKLLGHANSQVTERTYAHTSALTFAAHLG